MGVLSQRSYRRILIIKPSSFGDVIHALPVLTGLRRRFPSAHIAWLVSTSCAGLLEGHPALDEVIRFDRRRYGRIARSLSATGDFLLFLQALAERRFDLVLDLQGLFRSGFLALASGARTRVGFASARELATVFYTHKVPAPDREMHAVDRNYRFARALGFADVPIRFDLPVRPDGLRSAAGLLHEAGLRPGEHYVLIAPGTRWETKLWPAEHFAALIQLLNDLTPARVVLVGMKEEAEIAARVAELSPRPVINLAGKTNLAELIALVAGASLAVMHDSGPMHLAVALGRPMVAIYGPTNPQRTGPYACADAVARLDLPCSPCYLKKVSDCRYGHRCMQRLEPELVMRKIASVLPAGVRA